MPLPHMDRFKELECRKPTPLEWSRWMNKRFGEDGWDQRVYAFLATFPEAMLDLPNRGETMKNFPTPRSWTWLALDLKEGFDSKEDIIGLVGETWGVRFHQFLQIKIDVEELIRKPQIWREWGRENLDRKYMAAWALANYIKKKVKKGQYDKMAKLFEVMASDQREILVFFFSHLSYSRLEDLLKFFNKRLPEIYSTIEEIGRYIKAMS